MSYQTLCSTFLYNIHFDRLNCYKYEFWDIGFASFFYLNGHCYYHYHYHFAGAPTDSGHCGDCWPWHRSHQFQASVNFTKMHLDVIPMTRRPEYNFGTNFAGAKSNVCTCGTASWRTNWTPSMLPTTCEHVPSSQNVNVMLKTCEQAASEDTCFYVEMIQRLNDMCLKSCEEISVEAMSHKTYDLLWTHVYCTKLAKNKLIRFEIVN